MFVSVAQFDDQSADTVTHEESTIRPFGNLDDLIAALQHPMSTTGINIPNSWSTLSFVDAQSGIKIYRAHEDIQSRHIGEPFDMSREHRQAHLDYFVCGDQGGADTEPAEMKRTKGGEGGSSDADMTARNMSYTNLAAMASAFETSSLHIVPAAGARGQNTGAASPDALHKQAMDLINKGLKLDLVSPMQSVELYAKGADLLSQSLEVAPAGSKSDAMQRTLDMVEERVRFISREKMGRSISDSQVSTAMPAVSADDRDSAFDAVSVLARESGQAFNLFNMCLPEGLPMGLRAAQRTFIPVLELLGRCFGFQESSISNQEEHLALLLANATSREPTGRGLEVFHNQLLSNYRNWARELGTTPQCAGDADVQRNKATDLALYMLIWGEAANLRHVPECLCFIFHQMRLELWATSGQGPPRPQGWFLSRVVAPLYTAMRKEMNRKGPRGKSLGHTQKCNYDDFNEFFWMPECLNYSYYTAEESDNLTGQQPSAAAVLEAFRGSPPDGFQGGAPQPDVASMLPAKRYVERRNWLHPIWSFWRIHAFLLLALHVMLAFAFCTTRTGLVFDGALLESLAGLAVSHSALNLARDLIGVFLMYGMFMANLHILLSVVVRLVFKTGFAVVIGLSYRELLHRYPISSQRGVTASVWSSSVLEHNPVFCYAAMIYAVPVVLSLICQLFPAASTWARSWTGCAKGFIDIFEPLNKLLVGKSIHVPCSKKIPFDFFWMSLWIIKFWFSYEFQVSPLVDPTIDIWAADLSSWAPHLNLGALPNVLVLAIRWAPLVLMYMLDTQLWFMLWSAIFGTVIGCHMHIGEVPDMETVRERFLDASQNFNKKLLSDAVPLISIKEPPQSPPNFDRKPGNASEALRTGIAMSELRESLLGGNGGDTLRNESFRYFASAWNAVLSDMRSSDLVSNQELQVLIFNSWEGHRFSRCSYLPVFCTAGKLMEAFNTARVLSEQGEYQSLNKRRALERQLHTEIGRDFEAREAVVEFCELACWAVQTLLGPRHDSAVSNIISSLQKYVLEGQLLDGLALGNLPKLSFSMIELAQDILSVSLTPSADGDRLELSSDANVGKITDKLRNVLDSLKAVFSTSSKELINELESIKYLSSGMFWNEQYAKARLLALRTERQSEAKLRGLIALCSTARVDVKPTHWEVQRRLCWFVGSLFMEVPRPPPVTQMHSWSVLTPFYAEDLLYSARELAAKNEDGISVLYFLKTVYHDEWRNFLERLGVKPSEEAQLWKDRQLALELRLWASFRGQTLARTVEGMMLNERALRLIASWEGMSGDDLENIVRQKFSYTVSCQAYGQHKRNRDPKAADTEWLLQRFPNLRVAYVDKSSSLATIHDNHGGSILKESLRHYSVLIKGARVGSEDVIQEVFRVQLPGDIMLGEGKPENQNHAIIFTRGEALQTIDMNQCGYLEEGFKMRNLLHEFTEKPGSTILGFREHIFTGALSSLASYMALQEGCFVTLTQRVLYNPLQVRLHYGHPDVFDKVFSMTRGGVSKASRGINLSEDIYAGFNHLLRGGQIPYIEYVQVGKGRDVGMQQIYKFEAKLASGNAEQCLSRDVYRIGQRLDFTRLLSFYFSGPGFYFNNACTVFAMFLFLYLQLFSHLLELDQGVREADLLNAQWSLQLGLLLTVPVVCFLAVEHGVVHAITQIITTHVTGAPLFFMFHMGTKAHFFNSTLQFGGAKYRPTGRGFVMHHESFAELYRFHAGSHLYAGFELLWGLLLVNYLGVSRGSVWRTTWSIWLVVISWLFAPFWFNPLAFDRAKLKNDLKQWLLWMERKDASTLASWESWWLDEHSYLSTRSWVKKGSILLPMFRYLLMFVGVLAALSHENLEDGVLKEVFVLGRVVGGLLSVLLVLYLGRCVLKRTLFAYRFLSALLLASLFIIVPIMLQTFSILEILLLAAACGYLLAALVRIPFALGYTPQVAMLCFKAYDYFQGGLLLSLCFILSAPGFVKNLQNRALLSQAFDRGVTYAEISRLLVSQE